MSVKCTALVWEIQNISSEKKLVLLALADNANDNGECWPGLERIKTKCGFKSTRGIQLLLNKLVKEKYISVEERHRKDGRQTTNLYCINLKFIVQKINENLHTTLNASSPSPRTPVHPHPERQFIPPLAQIDVFDNKNNELQSVQIRELSRLTNNITNTCANEQSAHVHTNASASRDAQLFDEFWKHYPVKKSKLRSSQIWKKKKYDEIASLILSDIEKRKKLDVHWKDKTYIPNPSTYLNGELWQDEIITEQPKVKKSFNEQNNQNTSRKYTDYTEIRINAEIEEERKNRIKHESRCRN